MQRIPFLRIFADGRRAPGFIFRLFLSYAVWKGYVALTYLIPALNQARLDVNQWLGQANVFALAGVASVFGETGVRQQGIAIYLEGTRGLAIEDHCLAIPASVIFGLLVLFFPGPARHKAWFLPAGLVLVQASNLFRLAGLMFMQRYAGASFYTFNHSYTYVVITYGLIFLLLVGWMRFAARQEMGS